ncbi:hypothetical protein [Embleya sp. NBC_00896]|uniref:hypothetical protein n=1 Tax=Embleya sp. NBC_00896 TaxID=2975961 RepID=UPI00386BE948|nr:hypothetical protein OG928_35520 [Embleya sp. NBC_00896]
MSDVDVSRAMPDRVAFDATGGLLATGPEADSGSDSIALWDYSVPKSPRLLHNTIPLARDPWGSPAVTSGGP